MLYNIFGVPATTRMLFLKLPKYYSYLLPFLILLNYAPEKVTNIGLKGLTINTSDVQMDQNIVELLRKI